MDNLQFRKEEDGLGVKEIPKDVYWGIHTQRASENFAFPSHKLVPWVLIKSLAYVKLACIQTNEELGFFSKEISGALQTACMEIADGLHRDQFPLPGLQGGAGTSTNMNMNEVIANRALEILGYSKGAYQFIHPIEHVNLHQSTNDTYPTALKIALIYQLRDLSDSVSALQGVLQKKEKEFSGIPTIGRTELQDGVPITLGAQFGTFAEAISRDRWRTFKCEERIRTVNLGGTAVGTGITAPRQYIFRVNERLRQVTGLGLARAENMMDHTANADSFVEVSGMLSANASNLIKICNDLRLMNYFKEVKLPAVQAGSSIMPGKVNPVILEYVMILALKADHCHSLISRLSSSGSFQINEFISLIATEILDCSEFLVQANAVLSVHLKQVVAMKDICKSKFENSEELITAFLPVIGYKRCEKLLKIYQNEGESKPFQQFLYDHLDKTLVDRLLSPLNLMSLGYKKNE